jgi:hypothetical protein
MPAAWDAPDATKTGRSAAASAHGAKDVAVPQVPITWCEVWPVAAVIASVPAVVIGDPVIASHEGAVSATLVTTPLGISAATSARNPGCAALPVVGPAHTVFAVCVCLPTVMFSTPALVSGAVVTLNSFAGTASCTFATGTVTPAAEMPESANPLHGPNIAKCPNTPVPSEV